MKSVASSKSIPIVLGASVCGLAGYLLYLLFKNDDEDLNDYEDLNRSRPRVSNYRTVEVRIPKDMVRVLIGRNGKTIKSIQNESNTKINFKEIEEKDGRMCVIKGTTEACVVAENLIRTFMEKQSVMESGDLWVPKASVGRIIGRCGEEINRIMTLTGTAINIDRKENEQTQRVVIKGTIEAINSAKSCIEKIVRECENNLSKRRPRLPVKLESPKSQTESSHTEQLVSPVQANSQFEVYVSAMVDPSHFWLQLVGSKATELEKLVAEMTEYYGNQNNRDFHVLQNVEVDDLVAAVFPHDKNWYRAEVLTLISDNPDQRCIELYYLDYGDTAVLPINEVFELRTDFLRLYFQAIECFLARVEPSSKTWSLEALDKFEEWTRVAQWKKLSARINGYNVRGKTRGKRESSPVSGVDLFDVENQQDMDIAQELVKCGYAVFKKDSDLESVSSQGTSVSNTSVTL